MAQYAVREGGKTSATANSIYHGLYHEDAVCTKGIRQQLTNLLAHQDEYGAVSRAPQVGPDGSSRLELGASIKCFTSVLNPSALRTDHHRLNGGGGELLDESAEHIFPEHFSQMNTAEILADASVLERSRRVPNECPAKLAAELVESAMAFVGQVDSGVFAPSAQKLASGATSPVNIRIPTEPALFITIVAMLFDRVGKARDVTEAQNATDRTVSTPHGGISDPPDFAVRRLCNIMEWTNAALRDCLSSGCGTTLKNLLPIRSKFANPAVCCAFCMASDIEAYGEPITSTITCGHCASALRGLHWVFAMGVLCDARPSGKRRGDNADDVRDARTAGREAIRDLRAIEEVLTAGGAPHIRQCDLTECGVSTFLEETFRVQTGTEAVSEVRRSVTAFYISAGAGGGVLSSLIKELADSLEGAIDESVDQQDSVSYYAPGQAMVDFEAMDIDAVLAGNHESGYDEGTALIDDVHVPARRTAQDHATGQAAAKRARLEE